MLGGELPASPLRQPLSVGVLDDSSTVDLPGAGTVRPVLYELRQAGRTYVGWIVWVRDRPECAQVQDITDAGQPDAVVVRCALGGDGLYWVALHEGIRLAGLRLDPAGPGQRVEDSEYAPMLEGGLIGAKSPLPTGPGQVRLVDDAGRPRPPISLPPYRP